MLRTHLEFLSPCQLHSVAEGLELRPAIEHACLHIHAACMTALLCEPHCDIAHDRACSLGKVATLYHFHQSHTLTTVELRGLSPSQMDDIINRFDWSEAGLVRMGCRLDKVCGGHVADTTRSLRPGGARDYCLQLLPHHLVSLQGVLPRPASATSWTRAPLECAAGPRSVTPIVCQNVSAVVSRNSMSTLCMHTVPSCPGNRIVQF